MDIAVLIKQVPVSNDVSVDPETHALIRSSSEGMINPADLNAIEAAMVLKEQTGGKVAVFTMGPTDAEKALRDAMALGCDESCLKTMSWRSCGNDRHRRFTVTAKQSLQ